MDVQEPAPPQLPTVSVVVPTYNRADRLPYVLRPVLADPAVSEVLIVDDGSTDTTWEWLQRAASDEPRLRPRRVDNGGAAHARQAGVEYATGDVVLFLDDDVVIGDGIVTRHAQAHASARDLVLVGYVPNVLPERRRPGDFAAYLYSSEYESQCARYEADPESILTSLYGGHFSLPRRACLEVGASSPKWGMSMVHNAYHEDQDFGLRLRKAGLHGRFDRTLLGEHVFTRPLAGFLRDAERQGAGRWLVHHLHQEVLGPLPADAFTHGLPLPARWLLALGRLPGVHPPLLRALTTMVGLLGEARLFTAQTVVVRLARRLAQQEAALRMTHRHVGPVQEGQFTEDACSPPWGTPT